MKTCSFISLGCKVNQAEVSSLRSNLAKYGFAELSGKSQPDICVINTCALTQLSEAKSRKLIRRQIKLNPHTKLIITGCYAENSPAEIAELLTQKDALIIPNNQKDNIPNIIAKNTGPNEQIISGKDKNRVRAMLKIQDGCDCFCSYCIIPHLRGTPRSRPIADICRDAEELTAAGYKEIVLTGINLGSYNHNGKNIADVIRNLARFKELVRIRLSSIELNCVTDGLLDIMQKNNICPHLHIPLQSGSNSILAAMNRRYTAKEFVAKINYIEKKLDNPSFTTDVLLGFPGEEEIDFAETVRVCQEVGFSKIHIFPFSPRKRTPAAQMKNKVREGITKERLYRLQKIASQLALKYKQQFVGKKVRVLIEDDKSGLTERYLRVMTKRKTYKSGEIIRVKINSVTPDLMTE